MQNRIRRLIEQAPTPSDTAQEILGKAVELYVVTGEALAEIATRLEAVEAELGIRPRRSFWNWLRSFFRGGTS